MIRDPLSPSLISDTDSKALVPSIITKPAKVTRRTLKKVAEKALAEAAPDLLVAYFDSLLVGLKRRDKDSMSQASEMFGYIRKNGGPQVLVQQNNAQVNANGGERVKGMEQLLAMLEARDTAKRQGEEAVEAEFTEVESDSSQ